MKPLNAPRAVDVRTDSAGNPVAIHLAPGVRGAPGRRMQAPRGSVRAMERGLAGSPALAGRELERGSAQRRQRRERHSKLHRTKLSPTRKTRSITGIVSSAPNIAWIKVTKIEDLWKVNDEWWRGSEEEIARLYYTLRLDGGQHMTIYLDLITNNWYRQAG